MISVIIPCFNYGHLIKESLESLQQQTFEDIEIIVINDGSKDNTEEAVKSIAAKDKRISCYTFSNSGLGASRNRGLEIAKGEFIQFLDADDLLEKRKFEEQLKIFRKHPEADIVYGSVRYFSKDPYDAADRKLTYWGPDKEWMPKFTGPGKDFLPQALKGNFSHLSSTLFRRSIVDKVGQFDNEISAVADYHFLLRCTVANAFFYYHDVPDTFSLVRWHPDNMSKDLTLMFSKEIVMRKKLAVLLKGNVPALQANEHSIQSRQLELSGSWKRLFLSGGKFDFFKKILKSVGLRNLVEKFFYKS